MPSLILSSKMLNRINLFKKRLLILLKRKRRNFKRSLRSSGEKKKRGEEVIKMSRLPVKVRQESKYIQKNSLILAREEILRDVRLTATVVFDYLSEFIE